VKTVSETVRMPRAHGRPTVKVDYVSAEIDLDAWLDRYVAAIVDLDAQLTSPTLTASSDR